jgi:hypothetical protein
MSSRRTLEGVLARSQGRMNLEAADGAVSVLGGAHQFLPNST